MKLILDEKLKHRIIGLAVIVSLGAIFLPAAMKKSSQNLDQNISVDIKLPKKPIAPEVVVTNKKELFKTIKVVNAEIQPVSEQRQLTAVIKANPIKVQPINHNEKKIITLSATQAARHPLSFKKSNELAAKQQIVSNRRIADAKKAITKRTIYAIQLASFSQQANAQVLINTLSAKGYKANFIKSSTKEGGTVYKVYVGHSPHKLAVLKLKSQLARSMQLNGIVVSTGVS